MRIAAKRRSTVSCPASELDLDPSCLESALHSFLSTAPEGLARCRKSKLPPVEGSPSELNPKTAERTETTPCSREERNEKRQPKLQKEDEQMDNEAEKMCDITRKGLCYGNSQTSLGGERLSSTSCRTDRAEDTPATPSTPRSTTRDYFFAHNGDVGSPWTILSPITCTQRDSHQQNRRVRSCRLSSTSSGDDLDDGVWVNDEGNRLPSDQDNLTSPSGDSLCLPEFRSHRAKLKGPLRSASVGETRQTPTSRFYLGDLFQRSISQRSYSSGSRRESLRSGSKSEIHIEGQQSSSGFISFFRRIGGRTKTINTVEQSLRSPNS